MTHFTGKAAFFKRESKTHLKTADKLLDAEFNLMFEPYYNGQYHASSLLYPLCHAAKTVFTAARILKGSFLFLGALFNDPETNVPSIAKGLVNEFTTLALDILNIIVSTVSLITRTLSTLFNFGYAKREYEMTNDLATDFFNLFPVMIDNIARNTYDEYVYENTTQLSL